MSLLSTDIIRHNLEEEEEKEKAEEYTNLMGMVELRFDI